MAGWAGSGSPQARGACGPATPGSAGTTRAGAPTCTGCWGLCRLLVRPGVACRNLASHVLAGPARAVGDDCERLYGYRPWLLETFVDETDQTGSSVRAANWVRVGETRGRGRQDRTHAASETRKAVYMYALEPGWRDTLQAPAPDVAPLGVGAGPRRRVVGGARVRGGAAGRRAAERALVLSAEQMGESPMRAMTGAANGVRALVKGHYRLIDQPAESAVTVENILAPHRERTLRRMRTHDTVLCIQDGTRLNFTRGARPGGWGSSARIRPARWPAAWTCTRRWRSIRTAWRWASCAPRSTRPSPRIPRRKAGRSRARNGVVPLGRGAARLRGGGRAVG